MNNREEVGAQFAQVMRVVRAAIAEAARARVKPTEVWLGPYEVRIFECEMEYQRQEGPSRRMETNQKISGNHAE